MAAELQQIEQVKHERDRFVAFAFASADILVEIDEEANILFIDGATYGLLGRKSEDLQNSNLLDLVAPSTIEKARGLLVRNHAIGRMEEEKIYLTNHFGDPLPFVMAGFKLPDLKNHYYLTLSIDRTDISPEELHKRDIHSGLLKKENFTEAANKKIRAATEEGKALNVTLLDFPELKALIDRLTVDQANHLMVDISSYLKLQSIDGDTAGMIEGGSYSFVHDSSVNKELIVRDLVEITKKADPTGVGLSMNAQTIEGNPGKLTEHDSANALLYTINKFAHMNHEGFNINSLSESYKEMLNETVSKIAEFKQTVAGQSFKVAFQPIVDLKSAVIHHFETLVRFDDSEHFSNPFQFITFGEQAGIIGEFDLAMTQRTLDVLNEAAGAGNYPLVSINLSGKSLSSNLFMDSLTEILKANDARRKQVIFEITESAKINDLHAANDFIQELRSTGSQCCLDDFGVGESSFDYLRHLHIDFVKIDGSYVKDSINTPRGKHLLKAMVGLCRDLGIVMIAEMIEEEKVAHILWDSGVKFGQGYLFGRPTLDVETLVNCTKQTPFYGGIMRAKRVTGKKRKWWERKD